MNNLIIMTVELLIRSEQQVKIWLNWEWKSSNL